MPLLGGGLVANPDQPTTPLYLVTLWLSIEEASQLYMTYLPWELNSFPLSKTRIVIINLLEVSIITFSSLKLHGVKPPYFHLPLLLLLNKQWKKWQYLQGKNYRYLLKVLTKDFILSPSICRQTTLIFQVVVCCVHAHSHTCKRHNWEKDSSSGVSCFGHTALETIPKFYWL